MSNAAFGNGFTKEITMTKLRVVEPRLKLEGIIGALFDGELLVFENLESVEILVHHIRALVEDALGTMEPLLAEQYCEAGDFRRQCVALRKQLESDQLTQSLWHDVLREIGFDPKELFHDRLRLRIVPSKLVPEGRIIRPLPLHRDTWGSGIMAQVNWWLPVYPVSKSRTVTVWPEAFATPVENTSGEWDFSELISSKTNNYPLMPTTMDAVGEPLPIVIEPGAVLAFAAAHLHAGTNDTSGLSRITVDTRTVWQEDLIAERAAPNVDGGGTDSHWAWFTPPANFEHKKQAEQGQKTGVAS